MSAARYTRWDGESALLIGEWSLLAVPAGLNAGAIGVPGVPTIRRRVIPAQTTVVAIALRSSIAAVGADLLAEVWLNAQPTGFATTLPIGATEATAVGQVTVAPGDDLGVRVTTPAGWLSLTLDLLASLWGV